MLKKIKLYGDLKEITGHSELEAHVSSVGDCIRFLLMNWPQLAAHMNERYYQVLTDGTDIREEEIHYPVAEEIKIVPVIVGAGGDAGRKILFGAAIIGLAFATGGTSLAFTGAGFGAAAGVTTMTTSLALSAAIGNIGLALVLTGVSDLLFPPPKPEENDQDPRVSFQFGGTPNTSRAGTTHPVVYGEIFTGSTVISMNVTTDQVSA